MIDKGVFGPGRMVVVFSLAAGVLVGACAGDTGSDAGLPPQFVDRSATAGVDHSYTGEFEFFVGGGVAAFDCDGDGRDELFFAGGSSAAALYRNVTADTGPPKFEPVPSDVTDLIDVTGAYPIDIDSDDVTDLVVLRRGENVVLRGTGRCGFERANERFGIDGGDQWTTAFSATWEGANMLPTLAFGNYLVPDSLVCGESVLVRPDDTGTVYGVPEALVPGYCTLSMLFSDWDQSGRRDLRVTNDRHYYSDGEDQLWRIAAGEPPRGYTLADGWQPLRVWGMGIASADLTGDGRPEIFVTSQGDNKLQTLDDDASGPDYRDIALRRGVTAQRPFTGGEVLPSTAWHPEFADVNNDGHLDLFITKGNVEAQPDFAMRDPNNLLIQQLDGTFVESAEAAGVADLVSSRGAAMVDLDLDGLLDLVVVHRNAPVAILHNVGASDGVENRDGEAAPMGHWIEIQLRQPAPNTDAIGAWVEVRSEEGSANREVTIGGGHLSGDLGWLHVGLGSADRAEVRVRWPDGHSGPWMPVEADRFVIVERDADEATIWEPGP